MALINCPECSREVSDKAEACPNCGYGILNHMKEIEEAAAQKEREAKQEEEKRQREIRKAEAEQKRLDDIVMPSKPRFPIEAIIFCLVATFLLILLYYDMDIYYYYKRNYFNLGDVIGFIILGLIPLVVAFFFCRGHSAKVRTYRRAQEDFEQYKIEKIAKEDRAQALKEEQYRAALQRASANTTVRCPSCGSTQIQMVPRKWSAATGVYTNKVDRVCVACKKRF